MAKYYINSFSVKELWGFKKIDLKFHNDVNIIIGENASGKTTLLNLLRAILTLDIQLLNEITFKKAVLKCPSFEGGSQKTIKVETVDSGFNIQISNKTYEINFDKLPSRFRYLRESVAYDRLVGDLDEIITDLVPAVWLPVSRRVPIPDSDEEIRHSNYYGKREPQLESVDFKLRKLVNQLSEYRLRLEGTLSEQYKEFEKSVLQIMLYSKEHDVLTKEAVELPNKDDKDQLLKAFKEAGLLDNRMKKRIDDHFENAKSTIDRIKKVDTEKGDFNFEDLFIIPLIRRTKSMVQFAQELEQKREELFRPIQKFENILNSFLNGKNAKVSNEGTLIIETQKKPNQKLEPMHLSSGEKQILILLIQALLKENEPVVYVADEPELSLHVYWQEKLLESLVELGGQIQIIVATHSPDIVGPFQDKVINISV